MDVKNRRREKSLSRLIHFRKLRVSPLCGNRKRLGASGLNSFKAKICSLASRMSKALSEVGCENAKAL
jgi:hypothetical protein